MDKLSFSDEIAASKKSFPPEKRQSIDSLLRRKQFFVTKSPALWSLVAIEITHFSSNKIALFKLTITGIRARLPVQNFIRITGNNGAGINGV